MSASPSDHDKEIEETMIIGNLAFLSFSAEG